MDERTLLLEKHDIPKRRRESGEIVETKRPIPVIPTFSFGSLRSISTSLFSFISKDFDPVCLIPQRYVLAIMGLFAVMMAYTMRIVLSIAIVDMVKQNSSSSETIEGECPADSSQNETHTGGIYEWDSTRQGLILSSFFWGYVITHLPGGYLAERFGGKHTLGLGILSTAIFTLLTPICVKYGEDVALIIVRVLEGLGEGTTYPALSALLARWAPAHERGLIGSIIFAGSQIGSVVGTLGGGYIIELWGWEWSFYFFGILSVIWWLLWCLLCHSDPNSHPWISDKEKKYLEEQIGGERSKTLPPPPYKHMLMSAPLWALICVQCGHDWGFFTMVTDLPLFMNEILKFSISSNGLYSSLPYIVMWLCSIASGWLCDLLIRKKMLSITWARKIFTTIASVGPALFMLGASYAGCDRVLVVALFTIGMGLMGAFYPGMKVNGLDLSPNYAGTVMAIVNGIGAITGIIVPYLTGILTQNHSAQEWRTVFWICLAVFIVTNIVFLIWGSGEPQWWDQWDGTNRENIEANQLKKQEEKKTKL